MDNKRKHGKTNQNQEEPTTKKIRRKPLSLAESFSRAILPQEVKCLICARAIPPTRPETQVEHDQVTTVRLLGQLFKALRLSPEVCQCLLQISNCSPVTVIYCESCEEAISDCLKMEQKIDNLHSEWEQMATEIKENVYLDNHCRVDSSGSGNGYIRKTLVQLAETARAASSGQSMSTAVPVSNSFYIPVVNVALGGVVLPDYSSITCVDTDSFADKRIEEIGTPLAFSDLGESNKTQSSTAAPSTFTIKSVEAGSTQSSTVKDAREFNDTVNQKDGADTNDNTSLISGVPLDLPSCHEQIVNYLCDVKIEENSDTGSVYGPDSPFNGEQTACQDRHRHDPILLGVKPKWTRKTPKKNKILQIRFEHRNQEFPLSCSICGKGYHRKNILEKHEKAHEFASYKSFEFRCSECKHIRFASALSLSSHIARAHKTSHVPGPGTTDADAIEEVGAVAETNANGSDAPSAGQSPAPTNTNLEGLSLHKCPTCSLTFEDATTFGQHKRFHHGIEKKISCPQCIEKFASVTTARNHQIRIHGKSLVTAFDDEGTLDSFQCVYCKEEFVKSSFIIEDNSTDPPTKKFSFPDLPPLVSRSISDQVANSETIDFKLFHWNHRKFCKSRPRIESVWDKQDVPDPAENTCKFCQKEFANVDRCRNHEIMVHTKDFKFHCDICGRPCPDKVSLRSHRHSVHSERRFMCDQCPKTFKQNFELKNHMNTHSNIRSFICEHCGKGYCTRNVLWMHKKQSHKNCKT